MASGLILAAPLTQGYSRYPCPKYHFKVVLRLSEHGDVMETQTITLYLCDMQHA